MAIQTTNTETLLSLWAVEQDFEQQQPDPILSAYLFSGGQDSGVLAWFMHHTETTPTDLVHCNHLWQEDNFFMAQHALQLSFWSGRPTSVIFPTKQLTTEQHASVWRYTLAQRTQAHETGHALLNGHTVTDQLESEFFRFARTVEVAATNKPGVLRKPWTEALTDRAVIVYNDFHAAYAIGQLTEPQNPNMSNSASQHLSADSTRNRTGLMIEPKFTDQATTRLLRPLNALTRATTRLLSTLEGLPIYPDQTNWEYRNTRTQVRSLVFPLLAKLGFKLD